MIRFILGVTWVVSFLVLSIPLMLAEWIIGNFNPALKDKSSLAIVKWAFRVLIWICGTNVIVLGEENIPTDTAVLYVANHRSFFMQESPASPAMFPKRKTRNGPC